ncbi:MAG: hypothetical protein ACTSRU_11025 [Candidatus Hodarchaeales archaeon]
MQIEAVLLVLMELVIDPRFSIKRIAEKSDGKFTRKFLTQTVKHHGRYQEKVRELLLVDILSELPRDKRLVLSVDDTLVKKRWFTEEFLVYRAYPAVKSVWMT